jgi:hypothetical protein
MLTDRSVCGKDMTIKLFAQCANDNHFSSPILKPQTLLFYNMNCLCGLVVRVFGYRSRGPGFDSWRFQIFWEAVGLEQGPLGFVRTTEEVLGRKNSGSGLEKPRLTTVVICCTESYIKFLHGHQLVSNSTKKIILTKVEHFSKIYYHTSLYNFT